MIGADLTRCTACGKRFNSYHSMQQHMEAVHTGDTMIPTLRRYWNDPAYREDVDAERAQRQAELNAQIDEAQRKARAKMGVARD